MMNRNKARKALANLLVIAVLLSSLSLTSCGRKPEDASQPYTEEELYGDSSLGISAEADKSLKDWTSYLVMGIDDGRRSDIMLIVSINDDTGKAVMTSVDRDTYMQSLPDGKITVDGHEFEFYKANRSYKNGGLDAAMTELNRHMDLNIRDCLAIDWAGIAGLIDDIGGLDVDVEEGMLYWINTDAQPKGSGDAEYRIEKAGPQTLSGWQAVQYLRVRKYDGGNARIRAERSKEIVQQVIDKVSVMPEDKREDIYFGLDSSIDSSMSLEELLALADIVCSAVFSTSDVWPYEFETMWDNEGLYYYQVPTTLESNVAELHKKLFGQEGYLPSPQCRELSKTIEERMETDLMKLD